MRIDILTLFPGMFHGVLDASILKRAAGPDVRRQSSPAKLSGGGGAVSYHLTDIRDHTTDKHRKVDQPPFGGGPGMVLQCQPVWDAVRAAEALDDRPATRVFMTPRGRRLTQPLVESLAQRPRLMVIAGHYEGIDQRVIDKLRRTPPHGPPPPAAQPELADQAAPNQSWLEQISVGDYVLTGGELPAMVLIDAVVRLLPGVLGDQRSAHLDSFSSGADRLLDHPHYTRPRVWQGQAVPDVLLSGDHARIAAWRKEQALEHTRRRRPDLLDHALDDPPDAG